VKGNARLVEPAANMKAAVLPAFPHLAKPTFRSKTNPVQTQMGSSAR
jgi:hypothetical protein